MEIAHFLPSWREVAPRLRLDPNEVEEVEEDGKSESERRLKALQKWKSKFGFKATYMRLVELFCRLGRAEQAGKVCKLLGTQGRKLIQSISLLIAYEPLTLYQTAKRGIIPVLVPKPLYKLPFSLIESPQR